MKPTKSIVQIEVTALHKLYSSGGQTAALWASRKIIYFFFIFYYYCKM